jgi:threonyl-tRNA synthetase
MKILTLHSDFIKFKALKKALKSLDLTKEPTEEKEVKDPLVVMTAVEKGDDKDVLKKLVKEVRDIADQVKAENIVLYPYAHLSSNLGNPKQAQEFMQEAEKMLKKVFKSVTRAPFGYYKSFEIKVKGHPLSELAREIKPEGDVKEEKVDDNEIKELAKKLSKVKMSAPKGKSGLKSNVELGRDLDLYIVNEVIGQGLPLFTPKGTAIRREIENFITNEELKRGYEYTSTPIMAKSDLYKISGHWQHYKQDMFTLNVGNETLALRPMTCPFQFALFKRKPRSYKDLPKKYAEIANLFRNEKSGELRGLTRVRQFSLADAHIICEPKQLESQFEEVLDLVKYVMDTLGIKVWYRFSKHDSKNKDKYVNNPKAWKDSENAMKKILDKLKVKYKEAKGEAAFYGPKLDLQYEDVYGKEDTLITIQIDFALPERFDLKYLDKNNKEKRPMVIHRSSIGAIERTISYLLEKTQGALPTWLSPVQVRVINFTDRNVKSCDNFVGEIKSKLPMIRIDTDYDSVPLGGKIRDAELMKIPYIIVIGDKEEKEGTVAVRKRGEKKITQNTTDKFIKDINKEIQERK